MRFSTLLGFCCCFVALAAAPVGRAQTVINGNFEASDLGGSDGFVYVSDDNPLTDSSWTFTGSTGLSGRDGPWAPTGGATSQFAFLQINQDNNSDTGGSISQSITFTSAGTFTFSFQVGTREGYDAPDIPYSVTLTRDSNSSTVFSINDFGTVNQAFTVKLYTLTAPAAGQYTLTFGSNGDDNGDRAVVFDNVAIESAIPEPSTWAALAGGLILASVALIRRQQELKRTEHLS